MTDTERIDFIERTGASIIAGTGETLIPESFSGCIGRVTGWVTKPNVREVINELERVTREMPLIKERKQNG